MLCLKQAFLKMVALGVILVSSAVFATEYHKPDLFPIGFSGIGNTGYSKWDTSPPRDPWDGSPYPNDFDYGTWALEDTLLRRTHCNFIGCSDAWGDIDKNITLNYNLFKSQTLWRES